MSIVGSFFVASKSAFLIISTPSDLLLVISIIPLISTEGSLILEHISSITVAVFLGSFNSFIDSNPFLAISINAS